MSVNLEMATAEGLRAVAPNKHRKKYFKNPCARSRRVSRRIKNEITLYKHAPHFCEAGQSTQMIVGATPESDRHILTLTQALYDRYQLKRVFFSAYMPVSSSPLLPVAESFKPPLLREHRLYQADWLLRYYHFRAEELLDESQPTWTPGWTPSAAGPCGTWSSSRWR